MARKSDIRLRRSAVSGSIPTTSNLNLGELALNTADGKVYMKKSVGGTDTVIEVGAGGGIAASFIAYEYTATANQATFSGTDNNSNTLAYNTGTPPSVQVFMNGILLDEGSSQDYTGTNGTSVVLTTAADAGDLIQIHAYKSDVSIVTDLSFADNQKLQFGDSQDLQIYHDGSNSYINEVGTGDLIIKGGNDILFQDAVGNTLANMNQSNSVELYFGGSKKFETTTGGIQVQGSMAATTGAYSPIYYGGSSSLQLKSNTGELFAQFTNNGTAQLYHDNSSKLTTTSLGIDVTGEVQADSLDIDGLSVLTSNNVSAAVTIERANATSNQVGIQFSAGNSRYFGKGTDDEPYWATSANLTAGSKIVTAGNFTGILDSTYYQSGDNISVGTISSGAITASGGSSGRYTGLEVVNTTNAGGTETAIGLGVVSAGTDACDVKLVANRVGANSGSDFYIEQTDSSGTQQETFRITESGNATFAGTISSGAITSSGAIESTSLQTQNIYLSTALYTLNAAGNGWNTTINRNSGSPTANLPGGITSGNITTTGYLRGPSTFTIDPAAHGDDTGTVVIAGNLQIDGTTTTINSTTLTVDDKNITLASGSANAAAANGAGITVDGASATLTYTSAEDRWNFNKKLYVPDNIRIAAGAPSLILQDTTDDDDHSIRFMDNGGTNRMSITTLGDNLNFETTGSRDFTFMGDTSGSGNVGIGITTPAVPLHVNGFARLGGLQLSATTANIVNIANGDLKLGTNNTEKMRITAAGNVGIGTSNPTNHINTGTFFKPDSNGKFLTVNGGANGSFLMLESSTTTDNDQIGGIYFTRTQGQSDAHRQVAGIDVIQDAYAPNNVLEGGTLRFFTKTSGSGINTPRMVIAGGGNVGIGTNDPGSKLEVKSSGSTTNEIALVHSGNTVKIASLAQESSHGSLHLRANSGIDKVRLSAAGNNSYILDSNVGIGTTTPFTTGGNSKLTVAGILAIGASNADMSYIRRIGTGQYQWQTYNNNNTGDIQLQPYGGDVGIGTTTPTHKLHVAGDIRIDNGSALKLYNAAGNGWAQIAYNNTLDHIEIQRSFQSSTDSYYNLGSSAKKWLSVYSDTIKAGNGTAAAPTYTFDSDQNTGMWVDSTGDTLRFSTGGAQRMYLNSAGITSASNVYTGSANEFRNYGGTWKATTGTAAGDFEFRGNTGGTNTGLMYMDTSTGRVAVGNGFNSTNVKAALQVEVLGIETNQSSVASTSQYTCESFPAADFRSARYTVQVTNVTDSTYQITEILLIHDGTTPSMTEYSTIFTGSAREASFDADISSGNVRLLATPASTDSMQFKVVRHSILV